MDKWFLFTLVLALFLSIVGTKEISDMDWDLYFAEGNASHFEKHSRIRRYKGDDLECPNTSIMTFVAKIMQRPIDIWRSLTVAGIAYDYFMSKERGGSVSLILYTGTSRKPRKVVIAENHKVSVEALMGGGFGPNRKTVFIAHGFLGTGNNQWMEDMAYAYLDYENVNVVAIAWGVLALGPGYIQAAKNTIIAANQTIELAKQIFTSYQTNTKWGPIHLIGFSLGAHVVGMIGDMFKNSSNYPITQWKVERITGLDPAHPCFTDTKFKLDKNDAPFVDIIHTNGNRAFGATFGMLKPVGHVDFYVNGGEVQPGCSVSSVINFFINLLASWTMDLVVNFAVSVCSHETAPKYFIESLKVAGTRNGSFLTGISWQYDMCRAMYYTYTKKCDDDLCQPMGIAAQKQPGGDFFVPTARDPPYYDMGDDDLEALSEELERLDNEGKPSTM
ncbi:phospholipase A1 4-like [Diachasmimorpha longicaudata]|uniref:phospholipase A1 4-like n=1 Tax=Diachasmimorpha longicaudata TaxID=58733 RepID=UPI0030B8C8F3